MRGGSCNACTAALSCLLLFTCALEHTRAHTHAQAWSLLSIFVSTILGLVLDPLPVGAWAFMAVTVAVATKTLTFAEVGDRRLCIAPHSTACCE